MSSQDNISEYSYNFVIAPAITEPQIIHNYTTRISTKRTVQHIYNMATPPQSTSSSSRSRSLNIPSLTIYVGAGALTLVSAITVSAVFYLLFGPLGAILTAVLYSLALAGIFCCKRVVGMVCYPRYEMLSERRKSEVDEVRKRGIERLMEGATLVSCRYRIYVYS